MPIVVRYDSPALVAASAAGAGQFEQAGIEQQRAQNAYEVNQQANSTAFGEAQSALQQRRQAEQLQISNNRQDDQLALDQYGQARTAFERDRAFAAQQAQQTQQLQLDDQQKQQAVQQVLAMRAGGHIDDAQAARLIGIAQQGGNPFQEKTSEEVLAQQQQQLQNQTALAQVQGTIHGQAQQATFTNQQQLEAERAASQLERQGSNNTAAMDRTLVTQDRLDQRQTKSGDTPAQARLRANDDFSRTITAARTNIDLAKNDLTQTDAAIKLIASQTNPLRAKKPEDQARLDQLYAFKGTVDPLTGQASGLVKQLRDAQVALAGTASAPAATTASKPATIASDAEFDALPSGAYFIGPDGQKRRKP